jgi:hypothetical protein
MDRISRYKKQKKRGEVIRHSSLPPNPVIHPKPTFPLYLRFTSSSPTLTNHPSTSPFQLSHPVLTFLPSVFGLASTPTPVPLFPRFTFMSIFPPYTLRRICDTGLSASDHTAAYALSPGYIMRAQSSVQAEGVAGKSVRTRWAGLCSGGCAGGTRGVETEARARGVVGRRAGACARDT